MFYVQWFFCHLQSHHSIIFSDCLSSRLENEKASIFVFLKNLDCKYFLWYSKLPDILAEIKVSFLPKRKMISLTLSLFILKKKFLVRIHSFFFRQSNANVLQLNNVVGESYTQRHNNISRVMCGQTNVYSVCRYRKWVNRSNTFNKPLSVSRKADVCVHRISK